MSYKKARTKTTDINGNGTKEALITELTTGTGFKPIEDFSSTFDGQGNEIRNIYENTTGNAGLFGGANSAIIKNIGITGELRAIGCVGGIVGSGASMQIDNCYNKATIITSQERTNYYSVGAGGIIGYGGQNTLIINNCYNFGSIESKTASGGIMGYSLGGTKIFYNSCNLGKVEGRFAGGISGHNSDTESIFNCYNIGNIKGSEHARRIKW